MSLELDKKRGDLAGQNIIWVLLFFMAIGLARNVYALETSGEIEGVIRPLHRIKLNSQVTGKVRTILIREGDRVRKGDTLIELDDTLQRAAVEKAALQAHDVAKSKTAELRLSEARVVLEQMRSAFKKEAAAEWEVRRAELQVKLAEMEVKAEVEEKAKNEVLLAAEKERLAMHLIKAPVNGSVRKILAEPGQTVSASDPVVEVVDLSYLKAEFYLPINWYGRLRVGKSYALRAGTPVNRIIKAKLETADKALDSASQTFRAVFKLPNSNNSLPSGFQVSFPLNGARQAVHSR